MNLSSPGIRADATRTAVLTAGAMLAFAANSLFCRLALGPQLIDPASFAAARVLSAALTLAVIVLPRWRARGRNPGDWRAATALFAYLVGFSFAYRSISAGTGALILFGAAQLTMIGAALRAGEAFPPRARIGFALAVAGLVVLVLPGVTAPDRIGAVLMGVAGLAWGVYSLLGRKAGDPLEATANNFIYLVPLVAVLCLVSPNPLTLSWRGVALATASGAVASGLGYVVWYQAVQRLSALHAATVQLSVPVIAAVGGVILLSEHITFRLVVASVATLGGIATVLAARAASGRAK
jgi:drug/metabolite transporter (DMT)-like permease